MDKTIIVQVFETLLQKDASPRRKETGGGGGEEGGDTFSPLFRQPLTKSSSTGLVTLTAYMAVKIRIEK